MADPKHLSTLHSTILNLLRAEGPMNDLELARHADLYGYPAASIRSRRSELRDMGLVAQGPKEQGFTVWRAASQLIKAA